MWLSTCGPWNRSGQLGLVHRLLGCRGTVTLGCLVQLSTRRGDVVQARNRGSFSRCYPFFRSLLEAGQSALACRSLYAVTEIRLHHQEPRLLTFDQRLPLGKRVRRVSGWGRQLMLGADRAVGRQHHHLIGCRQRIVAVEHHACILRPKPGP